jgi:ubiquinone/menaquinone biosynthesis C-methylase UbiE
MNYFNSGEAAARYAHGRPDVHAKSIARIQSFLGLGRKVDNALDIACGTGLSTRALLAIAENVYGTDSSPEMLRFAPRGETIRYALAPADRQPFPDHFFGIITVSSGVHWFDIDRFLAEARRLLKSHGWLVLYENYFDSAICVTDGFNEWCRDSHFQKFPTPPRNNRYDWSDANLQKSGLHFVTELRSTYTIPLTKQQLVLYLTTQSNVIAQVASGNYSYEEVEVWLETGLARFFANDPSLPVGYGNWIKFIQRTD